MNVNEFLQISSDMTGYILASLTDEFIVDTWPMNKYALDGKEDKILEIRIFNTSKEERLFRSDISKDFIHRTADDIGKDYFDEYQYLDIDTNLSSNLDGNIVMTTGGGIFNLPVSVKENAKIKIRYYLDRYNDTGHVKLSDWRLVDFISGERTGN